MFGHKIIIMVVLAVVVLLLSALAGCSEEEPREVTFGCALSLSGTLEETGHLYQEGYELWKEQVNSQGGMSIGNERYLVDILYYDDESDPKKTGSLVEKLITEDEVDFLLGPFGSSCTLEAATVSDEYGVPMVQGGGAAEEIFTSGFEYSFGLLNPAADYFKNILTWATSINLTPNKVAIISASDIFSVSAAEGAKAYAEELEIFDVISIGTFEEEDEMQSILSDLKKEEPNMVLFAAHFEEAISFANTAKDVGLNPEMFGITAAPSDPAFIAEVKMPTAYLVLPSGFLRYLMMAQSLEAPKAMPSFSVISMEPSQTIMRQPLLPVGLLTSLPSKR